MIFNLRFQLVDLPSQRFTKDCASGRVWGEGDVMIIISVRTVWDKMRLLVLYMRKDRLKIQNFPA